MGDEMVGERGRGKGKGSPCGFCQKQLRGTDETCESLVRTVDWMEWSGTK